MPTKPTITDQHREDFASIVRSLNLPQTKANEPRIKRLQALFQDDTPLRQDQRGQHWKARAADPRQVKPLGLVRVEVRGGEAQLMTYEDAGRFVKSSPGSIRGKISHYGLASYKDEDENVITITKPKDLLCKHQATRKEFDRGGRDLWKCPECKERWYFDPLGRKPEPAAQKRKY
jgi:hypothetical protein